MTGSRKLIGLGLTLAALVTLAFCGRGAEEVRDLAFNTVAVFGLFCGTNAVVHWRQKEEHQG